MKKFYTLFLFSLLMANSLSSQTQRPDTADYPYWIDMMQDPQANFFETQNAFEKYWENRPRDKGDGWKVFKRWEYIMSQKVDEFGNKPKPDHVLKEYQKFFTVNNKSGLTSADHWYEIGPVNMPSNGTGQPNGLGRVNAIGFHPNNSDIVYVGAPAGGLWRTINHGTDWESLTDTLPTLGVSSIVLDYSNPSTVYIGTGDRDGGDAPGLGVWKSTDAGLTWFASNTGMGNRVVGKLIMNPKDSTTLLAATLGGIYKSTNSGQNWTRTSSNTSNYKDIVYKPGDTSVVYSTALGDFYRSADGGNTWTKITSGLPGSTRLVIGVTPANTNYVYLVLTNQRTFKGLYQSTNSGISFTLKSNSPNIMDYSNNGSGTSGQAWYDLCVAVDPSNANTIYVGGVNIFKSTDAGVTWSINAHWVGSGAPAIHADQHEMAYSPTTNYLYVGNDGGFYYTSNGGSSWIEISSGLGISQIYKIGQSAQSKKLVINGYQDNGTAVFDGSWRTEIGGDGMECIVDPVDSNYMYGALYYGDIRRSTNYGIWFSGITSSITETGEWVTPYILQEGNSNTMLAGFKNVWRSTNVKSGSVSWTVISNSLGGSNTNGIRVLENSPADNDILYIAREDNNLFRSDDINAASPSYTNLKSGLPTATWPLDIEAHPYNVDSVFIVQSNKVYASGDKGASWVNISANLPNVSMNCIVYDSSSKGDLYVGSDLGVFYRKAGATNWLPFSAGLPVAINVTELEIYYDANRDRSRIKASTYGRGLWSSKLYTSPIADFSADNKQICIGQTVHFTDSSYGLYHDMLWVFQGGSPDSSTAANPTVTYTKAGNYQVKLKISNAHETDEEIKTSYIIVDSLPQITVSPKAMTINRGDSVTLIATGAITYNWSPVTWLDKFKGPVVKASPFITTTYTVTGTNAFCNTTGGQDQATITVIPVGLEEVNFETGSVSIYPNPVNEKLSLSFSHVRTGVKHIELYDSQARVVLKEDIEVTSSELKHVIDLNEQPNGMYFLKLSSSEDHMMFKLLVDHSF